MYSYRIQNYALSFWPQKAVQDSAVIKINHCGAHSSSYNMLFEVQIHRDYEEMLLIDNRRKKQRVMNKNTCEAGL